jgi:ankyrin repeat protein
MASFSSFLAGLANNPREMLLVAAVTILSLILATVFLFGKGKGGDKADPTAAAAAASTPKRATFIDERLHAAAAEGKLEPMKELLELGADPSGLKNENVQLPWNQGPVRARAVAANAHSGVKARAPPRVQVETPYRKRFQQDFKVPDTGLATPFYCACVNKKEEAALLLLDYGASTDKPNYADDLPSLPLASLMGLTEVVKHLIEKMGVPVDQPSKSKTTSLMIAAASNENFAHLLLNLKADVNKRNTNGTGPLFYAVEGGFVSLVRRFIDMKADVNAQVTTEDEKFSGLTPLFSACINGRAEIVELLINSGANVNATATVNGDSGMTPLLLACKNGNEDIVKLLVGKGADINVSATVDGDSGMTPLHFACEIGDEGIVKLLVGKGADINARATVYGNSGMTPLLLSVLAAYTDQWKFGRFPIAQCKYVACIEQLLDAGADGCIDAKFATYDEKTVAMKDMALELQPTHVWKNIARRCGIEVRE